MINIKISSNIVNITHYCIEQFTSFDFNKTYESSSIGLALGAIFQNNFISLTQHLISTRNMISELSHYIEGDPAELFADEPLKKQMITLIQDISSTPTRGDVINIISNIQYIISSHYSILATKHEVHDFLLSIVKFYLQDEPINFNLIIKNKQLINEITQCSWLFEDINPHIKNLFLSKVTNNNFVLDIDIFYLLAANFPLYIKEVDKSLNFKNMHSDCGVFSDSFSKDLNRIKSIQASSNAKIKAEKYKQDNEQAFQNIEELWDTGKWRAASKCAEDIFSIEGIGLPYNTVYKHLRSYIKSKN